MILTKVQVQDQLNKFIAKSGINELLNLMLNSLMYIERKVFLQSEEQCKNKANGFRKTLARGYGKILQLHIPRDRFGHFKPLIQMLLREEEDTIRTLCFELYGKGLTTRQIGPILDKIYGKGYSSSTISKISQAFHQELEAWRNRPLTNNFLLIYIDAIHVKVRRGTVASEAFYVVVGVRKDGRREVLAIENMPQESATGWSMVLKKLRARGLTDIELVVADGLTGLENQVGVHYPKAHFQKCVVHLKRNILARLRKEHKQEIMQELKKLFNTTDSSFTFGKALQQAEKIKKKWAKIYPSLKKVLASENLQNYLTYLNYNPDIRNMIYTTNCIERLNKEFRRTLKIRNALPSVDSCLLLLSKVAFDIEQNIYSRRLYQFNNCQEFKASNNITNLTT